MKIMSRKKQNLLIVLMLLILIGLIGGVTYSFFNYNRTGPANTLATGEITFTSDYESVTLQNVFPIASANVNSDTDNVATVTVHVEGNTNYNKGMNYIIQAVDTNLTAGLTIVPVSVEVSSVDLSNIQIYSYDGNLGDGSILAAGKIPANTEVDGYIVLKAYLDKDKISISDTYNPVYERRNNQWGYYPTDENGTTKEWNNDRTNLTTAEWNSFSQNGISFRIKVVSNVNASIMGKFSTPITSNGENVKEVYFIKDTEANIDASYNAASIKADLSIFQDGSVKAYLDNDKLYVASPNTIYLSTGKGLFSMYDAHFNNLEKIEFNNINTSMVTDMSDMFTTCVKLEELDLSSFDTSNVTNMSGMFSWANKLEDLDLSNFDTSNVKNMSYMLNGLSVTNIDVSKFDTSNVIDMRAMFAFDENLSDLDLSNFDTSNVMEISFMFNNCINIETIYVSNLWNMANITGSEDLFGTNTNIVGGAGTSFDANHTDVEYARIDNPANNQPGYFTYKAASSMS